MTFIVPVLRCDGAILQFRHQVGCSGLKISTIEGNPADRPELRLRGSAEPRNRLLEVPENYWYDTHRDWRAA